MAISSRNDAGRPTHEDVSETVPVFLVVVDNQADARIFRNVAKPFEFGGPLRFFVDGREKLSTIECEADWNNERLTARIGRREMSNSRGPNKRKLFSRQQGNNGVRSILDFRFSIVGVRYDYCLLPSPVACCLAPVAF